MNQIGRFIEIKEAANKSLLGKQGYIVDESKNTFTMIECEQTNFIDAVNADHKKSIIIKHRQLKW